MTRSPTSFELRVYEAIRQIPRGRVSTYAEVARAVGVPAPRAVGQALRRNPFAPQVPCHRVIASTLTIGGFAGTTRGAEIERKRALLHREGVEFTGDGHLVEPTRLYRFS
ncbi:MAG: MGMT family protein [Verrucomicrobiales bacterium]